MLLNLTSPIRQQIAMSLSRTVLLLIGCGFAYQAQAQSYLKPTPPRHAYEDRLRLEVDLLHGGYQGKNTNKVSELTFPENARFDAENHLIHWFDFWLKGRDNQADRDSTVRYYVMGAVGEEYATSATSQSRC